MTPLVITASATPSKLKAWVAASRPETLPVGAAPILLGAALAAHDGAPNHQVTGVTLVLMVLAQILANVLNDYFDFVKGADTADRLGLPRASQRGWLSRDEIRGGVVALMVAIALGAAVGVYLVGWPLAALLGAGLAAAALYTAGPVPLAYSGLGELFIFLCFGPGAVAGVYFLERGSISGAALLASCAMGALAAAIGVVNNIRDRFTDAKAGKRTLSVRFGLGFSRWLYAALVAGAFVAVLAWPLAHPLERGWWLAAIAVPLAVRETRRVATRDGADLNAGLKSTAILSAIFGISLAVGTLTGTAGR